MPSPIAPDLSGLSQLARDPRLDLRPVLLRVQTDLFVTAPVRDREAVAAFEALAGGLLPMVDDATATIVARKLAACPDAPASVIAALERRGGAVREAVALARAPSPAALAAALSGDTALARALAGRSDLAATTIERLLALNEPAIDLALASNHRLPLSPDAVGRLVQKARFRPGLAEEVLPRSELTAIDRAALYLHAGVERRARIRAEVAAVPALKLRRPAPRVDAADRDALLILAERGEAQAFERQLESALGCSPLDWRFDDPLRHDLLGFALRAAGVDPDDAIRVALTLHASLAQSVAAVFRFAALVRETPRPVAAAILEATLGFGPRGRRGVHVPAMDPSGTPARAGAVGHSVERRPAVDRSRRLG